MTALVSYSTGTASVAAGGTTVTGIGTIWSGTNARPGDVLQIGNFQTVISDVTDATHLVIPPWGGGAQSGVAYKIWQVSAQRFAGAQAMQSVNDLVAALNTSGFFVFVDVSLTVPDPSLGDDGQYAFQPTSGKTWAKVAGVWTYLGIYKGMQFRGVYDNAATYSLGDVQTTSGTSYVYINATPSAGHTAPNTTYWQVLASIGNTGNTGPTGAGYGGTSTTSLAIGTGSKAFTTQAGLAYTNGARVRATATAGVAGWLEGVATYSGTTLTITSDKTSGSGTGTAWNLNVVGEPGAGDLTSANNLSDVANAATALNNLSGVSYGSAQSLTTAQKAQAKSNTFKGPTAQVFTSGSGAYTTPANVSWIEVEMIGGGGGGGGSGTSAGNGGTGGNSTFSTFTANGAAGSSGASAGAGGYINVPGHAGQSLTGFTSMYGGNGANSPFGGAGMGGAPNSGASAPSAGQAATANTGSGGGGAGDNATVNTGSGGGSGNWLKGIINAPSATYSYSVGGGGTAGAAGTNGAAGGAGASGVIVVIEHYD
ncbi:hypothetical protein [Bradyrhizobium sp. 173]|uniref:hypothetical protein n=1 Tax=Bradyrhizobium sp. 173 TaxID=2782644 RepID=UPI001FF72DDE|nr:hypothetical protein [Bradyrhizobium sp. 173]